MAVPPDMQHRAPSKAGGLPSARVFKIKTVITWLVLLGLLLTMFANMGLDWSLIEKKLPYLLGLHLSPDGFVQGAVLTLLITACSMFFCMLLGLITALGRMSSNALAFGCATFYASLFRGTPL